jgi:hypothetical protein
LDDIEKIRKIVIGRRRLVELATKVVMEDLKRFQWSFCLKTLQLLRLVMRFLVMENLAKVLASRVSKSSVASNVLQPLEIL